MADDLDDFFDEIEEVVAQEASAVPDHDENSGGGVGEEPSTTSIVERPDEENEDHLVRHEENRDHLVRRCCHKNSSSHVHLADC